MLILFFWVREPENEEVIDYHYKIHKSLSDLLCAFWSSDEFKLKKSKGIKVWQESKRTDSLSFHETATGKYYLPTDAHKDDIANTIISGEVFDAPIYETAKKYKAGVNSTRYRVKLWPDGGIVFSSGRKVWLCPCV